MGAPKTIDIVVVDSSYNGADSKIYELNPYTQSGFEGFTQKTRHSMDSVVQSKLEELFPDKEVFYNPGPDEIDESDPDTIYFVPENAQDVSAYMLELSKEDRQPRCIINNINPAFHLMTDNKIAIPTTFGHIPEITNGFPKQAVFCDPDTNLTAGKLRNALGNPNLFVFKPGDSAVGEGINFVEGTNLESTISTLFSSDAYDPTLSDEFLDKATEKIGLDRTYWPPTAWAAFPGFVVQAGVLSQTQTFADDRESYSAARTVWIVIDGKEAIPVAGYLKPSPAPSTEANLNKRFISSIDDDCIILETDDPVFSALGKPVSAIVEATQSLPKYAEWSKQLLQSNKPSEIALGIETLSSIHYPAYGGHPSYTVDDEEEIDSSLQRLPKEIEDILTNIYRRGPESSKRQLTNLLGKNSPFFQKSSLYKSLLHISRQAPGRELMGWTPPET